MKFYDSMGFESEHGIWVRRADAQEIAADRDSHQREIAERDARIRELEAELEKSINNARANWIDAEQLAQRVSELESCVLEYWHAEDWYDVGVADSTAAKLLPEKVSTWWSMIDGAGNEQ